METAKHRISSALILDVRAATKAAALKLDWIGFWFGTWIHHGIRYTRYTISFAFKECLLVGPRSRKQIFTLVARAEQIWPEVIKGRLGKARRWRKKASGCQPRGDSVPGPNKKRGMIGSCGGRLSKSTSWVFFSTACIWNTYIPHYLENRPTFFCYQLRAGLEGNVLTLEFVGFHLPSDCRAAFFFNLLLFFWLRHSSINRLNTCLSHCY